MAKIWKTIKSKKVFSNFRFEVFEDDVIKPDGKLGKYFFTLANPGVVVVPFDGKKFYLVNQHRYVLGKRMWEFPAGKAETKNFLANAKKELREETGITAKKWKYLGNFVPSAGSSNSIGKIFLAQDLSFGQPEREGGESDMVMKSFSLAQLDKMIATGKLTDGWAIVSLYFFKQYLGFKGLNL